MADAGAVEITVIVEPPQVINVIVEEAITLPVVTVEVPGIQGPSRADEPFEIDPVEVYLKARGAKNNGNENEQ